jgi:23S rRNA pseudouridine2605 synthase
MESYRIAKFIARSGMCSRREAEKLVTQNIVKVNNEIIVNLATQVTEEDIVFVGEKRIILEKKIRVWLYHKRVDLITTSKDPFLRETIFDDLPSEYANLKTIGRLDRNTEGLLVLTNDGEYARSLELPENKIIREYKVKIFGDTSETDFKKLKDGIEIEGVFYKEVDIKIIKTEHLNSWLNIKLIEGKNREIRRILAFLGFKIKRLIRVAYGPYKLGTLEKGAIKEVSKLC